jgi:hypothetical protein
LPPKPFGATISLLFYGSPANKKYRGILVMRDYSSATSQFDYLNTVIATLHGSLQALNACVECCLNPRKP